MSTERAAASSANVGVTCSQYEPSGSAWPLSTGRSSPHHPQTLTWSQTCSRRNVLQVTETELRCGNWTIPYTEIEQATLMGWRSWLGIPGAVLVVKVKVRTFQFGLMGSKFWEGELPFPVERKQGRPGYSTFSVILRVVVLAYLAWWVWQVFGVK